MKRQEEIHGWRWMKSKQALVYLWIPIVVVTIGHYTTIPGLHWLHDIFRRLYYIPIILGAFIFGVRGALAASVTSSILYFPHAFSHLFIQDPAITVEKILEILLYNIIAIITGTLADREYVERMRQKRIAQKLQDTLDEMKVMEEQLVRSGKLQALGQLTAGLAHEIKNPLASLKGATEIISDEIPEDSPRRKMVTILKNELDRLSSLLDRFLSFAKPQPFEICLVSLEEVIKNVILLASSEAKKFKVTITCEKTKEKISVAADKEKISQVFLNIVLNAIQAMQDGGELQISYTKVKRSKFEYARITFRDSGPGISAEIREKIFNPFFSTKHNGTGLGLAIASRIVDQHHGFIEINNNQDKGSCFHVFIPKATNLVE